MMDRFAKRDVKNRDEFSPSQRQDASHQLAGLCTGIGMWDFG